MIVWLPLVAEQERELENPVVWGSNPALVVLHKVTPLTHRGVGALASRLGTGA